MNSYALHTSLPRLETMRAACQWLEWQPRARVETCASVRWIESCRFSSGDRLRLGASEARMTQRAPGPDQMAGHQIPFYALRLPCAAATEWILPMSSDERRGGNG